MEENNSRDTMGFRGSGDADVPCKFTGLNAFYAKKYNKSLAFTHYERQILGIHGLLPYAVRTQETQVEHCLKYLDSLKTDMEKYNYLARLLEYSEHMFYKLVVSNLNKLIPLVYTPTVGTACLNYSSGSTVERGLFITIKDKGHVYQVLKNWPEKDVRVICVTDGEGVLGFGDLGVNGMPVPIGKLTLYTSLALVKPHYCLPITLDVGTNNQALLEDPFYIGLRQKRVSGPEYDEFLDEFMKAVVRRFGQYCVIHFEDFGNANAFSLLERYRESYCVFNDDIQGSGAAALAGIIAAMKVKNAKLRDNTILFMGAGQAALGIANLYVMALKFEGIVEEAARQRIWLFDTKGLICKNRPRGGINLNKEPYAHEHEPIDTLAEAVRAIKPTILIGVSAVRGAFTIEILRDMAKLNEIPIIFALSNPNSKAECTPEQALIGTKGKCLYASGSPFPPVKYGGKLYHMGQGNNSYVFPGVVLGIICCGMKIIPIQIFFKVAERLADLVSPTQLKSGNLYPAFTQINAISVQLADCVMQYAYKKNLAALCPEPENRIEYIKTQLYDTNHCEVVPKPYCVCG